MKSRRSVRCGFAGFMGLPFVAACLIKEGKHADMIDEMGNVCAIAHFNHAATFVINVEKSCNS